MARKKESLDSLKQRVAEQVSDVFKRDGWTSADALARSWSGEIKQQAFKNVSALMGVEVTWEGLSFKKDTEFWRQAQEAAKPFVAQIFLDLQPKLKEAMAKKISKIHKTVTSLVMDEIDEQLEELVRGWAKNELRNMVDDEARRVADAWFEESMATLGEGKADETVTTDEET